MGRRVIYLDASAIMRLIEGAPTVRQTVKDAIGAERTCTSVISLTECLVKPIRDQLTDVERDYHDWFLAEDLRLIFINREIAIRAAQLRASLGLKTPDSLHVAAALVGECSTIVTSDQRLKCCEGLQGLLINLIASEM